MAKPMKLPEIQIGDVVTGVEVSRTTSRTDRYNVSGTFTGSLVQNPIKGGFSIWIDNAAVAYVVMDRSFTATRRASMTSRNIKKIERNGSVIFSV